MSQVARSSSFRAMDRLAYPPAHSVAHTVEQHFRRHNQRAGIKAEGPEAAAIERIINAAFWASLRREEGRAPTISLAYLPPEAGGTALFVERPLPLDPTTLTKLAPAVERPGIHLGVWKNGDGLSVWGATRIIPPLCFVLEVIEPGLLVIKHRRADPDGKFANVVVRKAIRSRWWTQRERWRPSVPILSRHCWDSIPHPAIRTTSCCHSRSRCAPTSTAALCWSCRTAPKRGASRSCPSPTPSRRPSRSSATWSARARATSPSRRQPTRSAG